MTTLGPVPPTNTDAGAGPDAEDPRNVATLNAAGGADVTGDVAGRTRPDEAAPTERAENAIELKEVEGLSLGRIVLRRFLRHKAAMASIVVLALSLLLAYTSIGFDLGPLHVPGWWIWSYGDIPAPVNGTAPTLSLLPQWLGGEGIVIGQHPFGQDSIGHDMFAQTMRGAQVSLMIVVVVGIVSTVIGTLVGSIAGYFGGWIDALLMRATDLVIIVPLLLIAAIVAHTFAEGGPFLLALTLGLLTWTSLARLVRGEVLSLREREFVEAAKVAGAGSPRIVFRHILPNTVGVIIVSSTLTMSAVILLETSLSFLGLGVHSPDVSLGYLIGQYETSFTTRPWLFWYPGVFIVIIALCINFIGDGLRDAFDPRQRRGLNRKARLAKVDNRPQPASESA
jgi:ABC-type dipeptide/oligopeptide/nickel transport system permease subunit